MASENMIVNQNSWTDYSLAAGVTVVLHNLHKKASIVMLVDVDDPSTVEGIRILPGESITRTGAATVGSTLKFKARYSSQIASENIKLYIETL